MNKKDNPALRRGDVTNTMSKRQAQVSDAGCGIYLTVEELRLLGIDPDVADAVSYNVTSSAVVVTDAGGEE